jgi:Fanconi anemia group M protein
MYNFHRWYPQDLIIFMAPTRPLVTQQLKACQEIGGIAPSNTIELTGHTPAKKREELWKTKNVFFLTPQVVMNDLASAICPAERVRCVVVDEAHKATGDHAYVKAVSLILEKNKRFRVLGLSATIGRDLGGVGEVLVLLVFFWKFF